MQLTPLTKASLSHIYQTYMVDDFPKNELKPLSMLSAQMEAGNCVGWELLEEGQTLAYAIFAKASAPTSPVLLDYFAVNKACRSRGIGGICLTLLQQELLETYAILLEVEAVEKAETDLERSIRQRRISFYQQNGCVKTGIENRLFGVDFSIMMLPCRKTLNDDEVFQALEAIYQIMIPPERYAASVLLTRKDSSL